MITSLLFAFYIWLFWFWTPLKSRFWPCSFRPTLKKISPIENFHFFVFYQTTYSTLRKCRKRTCVFLINIHLLPGGGCKVMKIITIEYFLKRLSSLTLKLFHCFFTCTNQLHVLIKDVHTKILKWYFPNTSQLSTFVLNFSIDKGKISFQK